MSKTIEETYKKLTPREHVLHRPGMYIGSVSKQLEEMWIFDNDTNKMNKKMVEYSPGFLKIFDEVLTNATDHCTRDPDVSFIKVEFNVESGEISVLNNGKGVPIVEHKEHNMYVPELIFGHLLSGSNYDDNDKRIGSGTNGIGVKVANIYSKSFVVETIDSERNLKFVQTFSDNMSHKNKPKITKNTAKSYTKITFLPDYTKFGMTCLDTDTLGLLYKRVYDCIACTGKNVSIFLNGEKLKGKGLVDYVNYFFNEEQTTQYFESSIQNKGGQEFIWEYIIVPWEHYEQMSFVNGNATYQGGKHVDHIMYQIVNKLKALLETKKKVKDVKPSTIKEKMFIFLRSTVVNPQFTSQTKEMLSTNVKDFGCKIDVSEKFIDRIWKSPMIDEIVQVCKMKESLELSRATDGKKKNKIYGIPKLEDALWAGTVKSDSCTLILTEGDSAKTFAMWGRSVLGSKGTEMYGIFPLKGKVLNIRDATIQQLIGNEEINNLKAILGLQQGKDYTHTSALRYGKVICLTDADLDGIHIKALLVNFFHAQWPSLVKLNFMQTIRTPIIKAIKGKKVVEFFNEQDYHLWNKNLSNSGYNIRYFKGLGTSKKEDAQDTFKRLNDLKVDYFYKDTLCDDAILLAFEKDKNTKASRGEEVVKCTDKRKLWLANYDKNAYIDVKEMKVSYQDLINKELVHFSIYDNTRSIPNMCDGLKPSQRKILYYMLHKNITQTIKVAQLSGYISAETGYHHGEISLQQAIIGMGQDFIGSNNINLLYPDGNFGSRLMLGKDAASPRYIYTRLETLTQCIFNKYDTPLLTFLNDDGKVIEPEWFIPVVPMVLVNGCEGIGTGYSTYVPPYNPKDIIANILGMIDGKKALPMKPYFKGFGGEVVDLGNGGYMSKGRWERVSDVQVKITELPVGTSVTAYKEFLELLVETSKKEKDNSKKKDTILKDVRNQTTDENTGICFMIEFKDSKLLDKLIKSLTLEKELKLCKMFNTNNMYLFNDKSLLVKYKQATDVLVDFYNVRLDYYSKRRSYLIDKLTKELEILQTKVRFIEEYINGTIDINRKSKNDIVNILKHGNYLLQSGSYDYLTNMPLIYLSLERIIELEKQTRKARDDLDIILNKTNKELWKDDLQVISNTI